MFTQATSAGVSALTYQSIYHTNTPYSKRNEPFHSMVKNDLCMPALRYLLAGFRKTWNCLWSCSWGFWGLQILHIQDHNRIGWVPSLKHILALHTSATSTAGVSAGVSAFTYRHKHGTVNNLWILCHFHSQIHPESTLICLCTRITRRTWRTKHDNFHYCRSL